MAPPTYSQLMEGRDSPALAVGLVLLVLLGLARLPDVATVQFELSNAGVMVLVPPL
jgi:hypothetical protein